MLKIGNNLVRSFYLETYKKGLLLNYFAKSSDDKVKRKSSFSVASAVLLNTTVFCIII